MSSELQEALDVASAEGATYADVRHISTDSVAIGVKGSQVEGLDRSHSTGVGIRVLIDGAWGYAASAWDDNRADLTSLARTAAAISRASSSVVTTRVELVPEPAHQDEWHTPVVKDPFAMPVEDQVGVLLTAAGEMEKVKGVRFGRGTMDLLRQRVEFSSSEGSSITQTVFHTGAGIEAMAVSDGEVQQRSYPGSFRGHFEAGGFEIVEAMDLTAHAQQTAEEAVALLEADECPTGESTLVLDGHQVMLQVHESVGHPTELDRVLGMEAAFAGTSFVGLAEIGSYRYGSDLVNITSDATIPGGLGTFAYDDEGVAAQRFHLVENGVLVGFQTSRETAAAMGADRSNGTMRAEGWENFPLIRMTNINLLPGEGGSLEDLLADVDDGIYMATNKSWSIDDKRKNFQFGCEIGWEIKKGKLGRMLKNPRYTGTTPVFWGSCDAVASESEWKVWGTPNCGKGQPGQTMRVGHGTVPARFRNVAIGMGQ